VCSEESRWTLRVMAGNYRAEAEGLLKQRDD
jgi:hypothetical protein